MAGECIWVRGSEIPLETTGGGLASAGFAEATASITAANVAGYKGVNLRVVVDTNTAPASALPVRAYFQYLAIDGTLDEPEPDANFRQHPVDEFVLDIVATEQQLFGQRDFIPMPRGFAVSVWIENATGVQIDSRKLYATPVSEKLAP